MGTSCGGTTQGPWRYSIAGWKNDGTGTVPGGWHSENRYIYCCARQVKYPPVGNPDRCKAMAAGAGAFAGILMTLEATKKIVNDMKKEYDMYFSKGQTKIEHGMVDG